MLPGHAGEQVRQLRKELDVRCYAEAIRYTDTELLAVIAHVRDRGADIASAVGLVADALLMWPRPTWLANIIGPGDMPNVEMTHPEDRARPGEWGTAG